MDVKSFYKRKTVQEGSSSTSGPVPEIELAPPRPLLPRKRNRLLDPHTVWKIFPLQQMAFDFARTCWQSAAVFAFESEKFGHEGQRKYLVTTYQLFSQKYFAMQPPRHFYEVIAEGAVCRIYFDIEFKIALNPQIIPIQVLDIFIEYVCYQLSACFHLSCNRTNILDLDSTTDTKFSRHLIFHLPNAVFTNNIHIGNWVHYICDELRRLRSEVEQAAEAFHVWKTLFSTSAEHPCPSVERLLKLFVSTERGDVSLICDEGVYTRNRNFRLILSSKLGKKSYLRLAQENNFKSGRSKITTKSAYLVNLFLDSLICNVSYEAASRVLSFEPHTESSGRRGRKRRSGGVAGEVVSRDGLSSSPYPLVDSFITSCVRKGGVQGAIHRWSYFQQERLLVYDIKHNRWCDNIQRAHKSNNIMMVADLQRGVYYQKCHDPVCKSVNFKSNECAIPSGVNPFALGECSTSGSETRVSDEGTSEWLATVDLSLEELQDFTVDEIMESCSSLDSQLEDDELMARISKEMDMNISTANPETVLLSQESKSDERDSHVVCSTPSVEDQHCECSSSQEEDLFFNAAYDAFELDVKRVHVE